MIVRQGTLSTKHLTLMDLIQFNPAFCRYRSKGNVMKRLVVPSYAGLDGLGLLLRLSDGHQSDIDLTASR
jgi:hypothetical protein